MNESRNGRDAIAVHIDECPECRGEASSAQRIAAVLERSTVPLDVAALSQQTMAALRPQLAQRARAVLVRRVAIGLIAALLPLPLVVAYDAYLLDALYRTATVVLPAAVVSYLVGTYIAFLTLLFGGTYAAIPLLLARRSAVGVAPTDR